MPRRAMPHRHLLSTSFEAAFTTVAAPVFYFQAILKHIVCQTPNSAKTSGKSASIQCFPHFAQFAISGTERRNRAKTAYLAGSQGRFAYRPKTASNTQATLDKYSII
jgi:hypothetical protein